jgi:hypothetical protein
MWPAFPTPEYYGLIRLPVRHQPSSFSIGKSYRLLPEPTGSPKFLILLSIHATFSDPGRPSGILPFVDSSVLASVTLNMSPSAFFALTRLNVLQDIRLSLWPIWFSVYASPYCCQFRSNTRYGWLARPYPARTFTLQEVPSFAWRTNVSRSPAASQPHSSSSSCGTPLLY